MIGTKVSYKVIYVDIYNQLSLRLAAQPQHDDPYAVGLALASIIDDYLDGFDPDVRKDVITRMLPIIHGINEDDNENGLSAAD